MTTLPFRFLVDSPGGAEREALEALDGLPRREEGDPPDSKALSTFHRAARLNPDDPDYLYILGAALAERGRHFEAIVALREGRRRASIPRSPTTTIAWPPPSGPCDGTSRLPSPSGA